MPLVPTNVHTAEHTVKMSVLLLMGRGHLDAGGRLTQPVTLLMRLSVTAPELTFAAGQVSSPRMSFASSAPSLPIGWS